MSQAPQEMRPDEKGSASLTLGEVVRSTRTNFPDSRFHPDILQTSHYALPLINPHGFKLFPTADGIGTKPELAERLYAESLAAGLPDEIVWEGLAFDTLAMIEGDSIRFGTYMVGATNVVDTNSAENMQVVHALARGLKAACDKGQFALLNGETAELGYRASGYGDTHVNWNANGIILVNREKLFPFDIQPGQPVVALRETSIRSNGLSMARRIMETAYFGQEGVRTKEEYLRKRLAENGIQVPEGLDLTAVLRDIWGHDALEQVLPPWHRMQPELTRQVLQHSQLYGPVMYAAQGKIDEPRTIDIVAAAHISGGGVPEKTMRMVKASGCGVALNAVFPDPQAVTSLLEVVDELPPQLRETVGLTDRVATQQWNRGIGFTVVTRDHENAQKFVELAAKHGYEAAIAGEVIDKPEIQFRGHTWRYTSSE